MIAKDPVARFVDGPQETSKAFRKKPQKILALPHL
jgi:hypothetical protein